MLILTIPATVGLALYLVLRHLAARESAHTAAHTALVAIIEREAQAHRAEVQTLLQRVQAPREAVIQHMQTPVDDEPYPNTERETAAHMDAETASLIEQIERVENEGLGLAFP